jgi:hypothetical protein
MGNMPQLMQMQSMQQQNQLNQMTMQEKQRGQQEMNALRGLMSSPDFDLSTPASQRKIYEVAPQQAEKILKGYYDNLKTAAEVKNLDFTGQEVRAKAAAERAKLIGQAGREINSRPDNENIISYDRDIQSSPLFTPEEKQAAANRAKQLLAMSIPDRMTFLSQQGISAGELSTAATAKAGQGVTMRGQDIVADTAAAGQRSVADTAAAGQRVTARGQDIVAGTAKAGQGVTMRGQDIVAGTAAAGQRVTARGQDIGAATARAAQTQALELANRPVYSETSGGFVSRPTAAQPGGAFTPLPEVKTNQDQRAALKALKTAGYDPKTGEDNISKLISKSTSGGLQAASAAALGFFDVTTSGMKAIGALAGTANQIALDVAGGKLGAGISNADRDFIVTTLGDVANPYKTADQRLASWTAAKDRMVQSGMIPPPNKPSPGAPTRENAARVKAAPSGVDPALWGAMTPEEQKLWAK